MRLGPKLEIKINIDFVMSDERPPKHTLTSLRKLVLHYLTDASTQTEESKLEIVQACQDLLLYHGVERKHWTVDIASPSMKMLIVVRTLIEQHSSSTALTDSKIERKFVTPEKHRSSPENVISPRAQYTPELENVKKHPFMLELLPFFSPTSSKLLHEQTTVQNDSLSPIPASSSPERDAFVMQLLASSSLPASSAAPVSGRTVTVPSLPSPSSSSSSSSSNSTSSYFPQGSRSSSNGISISANESRNKVSDTSFAVVKSHTFEDDICNAFRGGVSISPPAHSPTPSEEKEPTAPISAIQISPHILAAKRSAKRLTQEKEQKNAELAKKRELIEKRKELMLKSRISADAKVESLSKNSKAVKQTISPPVSSLSGPSSNVFTLKQLNLRGSTMKGSSVASSVADSILDGLAR
jgi:hypothetical protein